MLETIVVAESALKHGYSEDDVVYAWLNCAQYDARRDSYNSVRLRLGPTLSGDLIELLGERRVYGWRVFHAMRPTAKTLRFFGLR